MKAACSSHEHVIFLPDIWANTLDLLLEFSPNFWVWSGERGEGRRGMKIEGAAALWHGSNGCIKTLGTESL